MRAAARLFVGLVVALQAATAWAHPPAVGPGAVFASGLTGPEGLAFTSDGTLVVGSAVGEIRRYAPDGSFTVLANVGEPLAGITVLRDGRVLAASFTGARVWSVDPDGNATVFASGIPGANFIVQTRKKRILVSASSDGTIVDITSGTPVVRASGLSFPNGLAIGPRRFLYVAELGAARVSRLPMAADGSLGPPEVYATGLVAPDGIAFDRSRNLLVVGGDTLSVVDPKTQMVTTLSSDPLLEWPSNLAFGRGRDFDRHAIYLANFGVPLGSGTTVVRFPYNHVGARLIR